MFPVQILYRRFAVKVHFGAKHRLKVACCEVENGVGMVVSPDKLCGGVLLYESGLANAPAELDGAGRRAAIRKTLQ